MRRMWIVIGIGILLAGGILLWLWAQQSEKQGHTTLRVINQSRWSRTIEQATKQWNEEHPEQQVVLDQLIIGYPQLRNKLITACGAGRPPDISILDSVWSAEFAQAGHLAALDEIDSRWNDAEFLRHIGYTLMPSGPGGVRSTTAGGMCYVVYEQSAQKKLAFEIVKLATSAGIMKEFLLETYQHPPRISIAEGLDEAKYPFLAETAHYLYQAKTRPTFPEYSRLSDLLQEMVEKSVRGDAEPVSAVKEASRKIRDLVK